MLRFGGRRGNDTPATGSGLPAPEIKDAIAHLMKQLVRAEAIVGSDRRLAAQVTLLNVELERATLAADYEALCEKIAALSVGGGKLPDAPDGLSAQIARAWIGTGHGLAKALNDNAHTPALSRLSTLVTDSVERARDAIAAHMEMMTDEVRWVRERGELLALTVSQIGASLVTMAADGPLTRARLVSIQEQIEGANDPRDIERLRSTLITHTHRLIEEVEEHTRAIETVRDQAQVIALPAQATKTTSSASLLPPGLIGTAEMLDRALATHAKSGHSTVLLLLNRPARIDAQTLSAALQASSDRTLEAFCRRTGELLVLRSSQRPAAGVEILKQFALKLATQRNVTAMTHAVGSVTTWESGQSFEEAIKRAAGSLATAKPGATVVTV